MQSKVGRIRYLFQYRNDGLYWNRKISTKIIIGNRAGTTNKFNGYRYIKFDGYTTTEHRLVYIYFNGDIPKGMTIDHINRSRADNRIENLRLADMRQQTENSDAVEFNKRGLPMCVYYDPTNKKNHYYIRTRIDGKKKVVGWAKTSEGAYKLYKSIIYG
jgi:hypothetical protein